MKEKRTVRRIMNYIFPYWYYILISTIGGVVKLTIPLIIPQILKYFTDVLLVSQNRMPALEKVEVILKSLFFLCGIYVFIYIPATYLREVGALRVSNKVMHKLRCQLYDHLLLMSARFHSQYKSGELVSRINNDIEQVHGFIWSVATNIWIDAIVLVIYISLMLPINIALTIFACIMLPISTFFTKKIRFRIKENGRKRQDHLSKVSGYFQERMSGFTVIRLFHVEEYERKKFNELSLNVSKYTEQQDTFSSIGAAASAAFYMLIQAIILCTSALYVVNGKMTIGSMLVFYSYVGWMLTPLQRFSELNLTYAKSIAGLERIFEILDMQPDFKICKESDIYNAGRANLVFSHVGFWYDKNKNKVLDDINIEIEEGKKIALVGRSGCGKTTLANLIVRFFEPCEGEILYAGRRLEEYSFDFLYKQVGMVTQDTILFSTTIADNLKYGKIDASIEELEQAARAANAYDFIMSMPDKWETVLGEDGIGLSGGQKQRLAIARVFLKNPKILILDEATSALDIESEKLVQDALDRLMKGRTCIVIAHRLSTVINADMIYVLEKGKIVESGSHEVLLKKQGHYAKLYNKQFLSSLNQKFTSEY